MLNINVESALTSVLLIVAIVAVIFLIVLLSKVIQTMDKVNNIVDESAYTVHDVKKQVSEAIGSAKNKSAKVSGLASSGISTVKSVIDKLPIGR
ncbi:MAG: hypothetical protein KBS68_04090 [Clostridiales bacterium]|nr:hypothetical protein [Candidatus Crickella merdequi]